MRNGLTSQPKPALAAILLAIAVALLSVPFPLHACLEAASDACTCCCSHEPTGATSCCTNEDAATSDAGMAAADVPVCCFTVAAETGSPTLPARELSQPIPASPVNEEIATASMAPHHAFRPDVLVSSPPHHGPRLHLALCQLLI